jgi:hypothetical protein
MNQLQELIHNAALLLSEQEVILASPEDADFFRKGFVPLKKQEAPPPPIRLAPQITPPERPIAPVMKIPETVKQPAKSEGTSSSFLKALFKKIAPGLQVLDLPPDDTKARNLKEAWKTINQAAPISVILLDEPKEHQMLLKELTLALNVHFDTAKVIDAEPLESKNQWGHFLSSLSFKLIIVCDATLWQLPNLRAFYREVPSQQIRYLKQTPLLLLPDLSLYLKDPALKKSLWAHLCQLL